jgi:hypothetical protein
MRNHLCQDHSRNGRLNSRRAAGKLRILRLARRKPDRSTDAAEERGDTSSSEGGRHE